MLVNARVWQGGDRLAIAGDKIAPQDAEGDQIDLGGATVLPGLVDAHVHFPSWALGRRELRLFGTRSLSEALERIEAAEKPAAGGCAAAGGARRSGRRANARPVRRSTPSPATSRPPCAPTTATRCG